MTRGSRRRRRGGRREVDAPARWGTDSSIDGGHGPSVGRVVLRGAEIELLHPPDPRGLITRGTDGGEDYPPYWAELWLSGIELAYAVSGEDLTGLRVLELGCGLGVPSVAAALSGATVLATDRSSEAVGFAARNAERNGVCVDVLACSWAEPSVLVERGPWDLVLAADVLYDERSVRHLLDLLPRLVDVDGEVWLADPQRPRAPQFLLDSGVRWRSVTSRASREPVVLLHRLRRPWVARPFG